jgi:hypothetical protein
MSPTAYPVIDSSTINMKPFMKSQKMKRIKRSSLNTVAHEESSESLRKNTEESLRRSRRRV